MKYTYNVEARPCDHCCIGKAISITQPECVFVALVTQHASACAILSSVACPAVQYFFHIIS